jgi:uncharacterized protein
VHELILFAISIGAGFLGSLLGIGGGMIVVPVLSLYLHVDIRYAIAASLISIVATSSGAAASFLRDHMTNLRVAVLLEVGTVSGAITGFLIASFIQPRILFLIFGLFLLFSALMMLRKRGESLALTNHAWSEKLKLASSFPNEHGVQVSYMVEQVPLGLFFMYVAGVLSALLGIGSGVLKVLAMDGAMKLPMKVSSATSNFMIGVTATTSAGTYFVQGSIRPEIAAPVAVGIIGGSYLGAKAMMKMKPQLIRVVFVVLLTVVSIQMIMKGLG